MKIIEIGNDLSVDFSNTNLFNSHETSLFEQDLLANSSLNELVEEYNRGKNNQFLEQLITYRHEISAKLFYIMRYAFWQDESIIYYQEYDKNDVESITSYSEDYLRYNPDSSRTAHDIGYNRIYRNEWSNRTSCYPIAMFREIYRRMENGDVLKLFKAYDFIKDSTEKYHIDVVIVFELAKVNGQSYYFDISDDPGN